MPFLLPFSIGNICFHLVRVDFTSSLICMVRPVHVDVHDVFSNSLSKQKSKSLWSKERRKIVTLSLDSLCSSLTMKIMSNRDKMVVWKSMF